MKKKKSKFIHDVTETPLQGDRGPLSKNRISLGSLSLGSTPRLTESSSGTDIVRESSRLVWALFLVIGILASLTVHFSHLGHWNQNRDSYYHDGIPLMSTLDAYFYLRLTSDYLNDQYHITDEKRPAATRPHPVPLLVSLTAMLHRMTRLPPETIAFYLPPLLASLMAFVYMLWGRALGSPLTGLIASFAGASSFYWYTRTFLGRFDTDGLIPFFALLIVFLVYRFCTTSGYKRPVYLILSLAAAYIFSLWWVQIKPLGFLFILSSYSLSFFLPSSKVERAIKIALLLTGSVAAVSLIFGFYRFFPAPLDSSLGQMASHFNLVSKKTGSLFPDVGQSITELQTDSVLELAGKVSGHAVTFALSLIGLFFLIQRRKEVAVFFVPVLSLGLLAFFSRRFLIFLIPFYALGIGYLAGEIVFRTKYFQEITQPFLKYGILLFVCAVLFSSGYYACLSVHPSPAVTSEQAVLAGAIPKKSSSDGFVWAWWDYGYFLQHATGSKTLTDGGSQSPDRLFVTAFPLNCDDPVLARNWIRFFATHDLKGLYSLSSQVGGVGRAVAFLKEALGNPENLDPVLSRYGLKDVSRWRKHLFPEKEVLLYLSTDFIDKAYWWYYFGSWNFESQKGVHPWIFKASTEESDLDEQAGVLRVSQGTLKVDRIVHVDSSNIQIKETASPKVISSQGGALDLSSLRGSGRVAVRIMESSSLYVFDGFFFNSMASRLLFQDPRGTSGFKPVHYHPLQGGVWRVE